MFLSNGKWFVGLALGLAGLVAPARAQVLLSLNVQRVSDSSSSITVPPSTAIDYKVVGSLNNTGQHMGLALVGFNLVYNGGALPQANTPTGQLDGTCNNPMVYFVKPTGITNPQGYGGTAGAVGELIQVGGGQNTIKNTAEFAGFPVGPVKTGVAQANPPGCGPAVIATGSLVAPATAGVYTLNATQLFANVIEAGQTGSEDFWVTKAAQAGTITPLTITVRPGGDPWRFTPADEGSLWRNQRNTIRIRFGNTITAPVGGELLIREMLPNGQFGPNLNTGGAFTASVEDEGQGNRVLRIRETGATLRHRKWYDIRSEGVWAGTDPFNVQYIVQVGDFDGNRLVLNADVLAINAAANGARPDQARDDIDGNGFKVQADVLLANSMVPSTFVLNLAVEGAGADLAARINSLKVALRDQPGGSFYINEYQHILAPVAGSPGSGVSSHYYYAGRLANDLTFEFEGKPLTTKPMRPDGTPLNPGDRWIGPRPGIPYVLAAGAGDIYFETPALTDEDPPAIRPSMTRRVQLSKVLGGKSAAARAVRPVADIRGHQGGRFYVNEQGAMFTPVNAGDGNGIDYVFCGEIDRTAWFPEPPVRDTWAT